MKAIETKKMLENIQNTTRSSYKKIYSDHNNTGILART